MPGEEIPAAVEWAARAVGWATGSGSGWAVCRAGRNVVIHGPPAALDEAGGYGAFVPPEE
ncbi:hypothetical protein [Streptomyces sp. NPDC088254]|uniref:hypothetical protein n=1 Tax=Streptomyces sp. NPDC088254 TaxID=3365847 RepID=UPI003813E57E